MSTTLDRAAIEKLSVEERCKLMELIWETLVEAGMPRGPDLPELQRRFDDAIANPDDGMTLEEFTNKVRERRKHRA